MHRLNNDGSRSETLAILTNENKLLEYSAATQQFTEIAKPENLDLTGTTLIGCTNTIKLK